MTIKIFANPGEYNLPTVLIAHVGLDDEIKAVCRHVTFENVDPRDCYGPTFAGRAGLEFLKAALNAAWAYGIRPDGWKEPEPVVIPAPGREGEIARMEQHIADLRRLVFAELVGPSNSDAILAGVAAASARRAREREGGNSRIATGD